MACVTLKRSLDHDAPPTVSVAKRRRFHHHHCGSRSPTQFSAASASSSSSTPTSLTFVPPPAAPGALDAAAADFPASRLPPELLSQRLVAEVRRLQRRRQLPAVGTAASAASQSGAPRSPGSAMLAAAAVQRGKSPESDSEMVQMSSQQHQQVIAKLASSASMSPSALEPALFTLPQVQAIAEKLLAEREQEIRSEFQALLSAKLQEQYDAFLRFNHDQIYRMHSAAPMSYVS